MDAYSRDLRLVAEASQYRNITLAAQSLQISQPHLSRLIQKIEKNSGISLLNRESKKKTAWTDEALLFFQEFKRHQDAFQDLLHTFQNKEFFKNLKIVCLEGLTEHTLKSLKKFRDTYDSPTLQVDILDLSELELAFASGAYDVAVSSRPPAAGSKDWVKTIGYQTFQNFNKSSKKSAITHFELHKRKDSSPDWITNSLIVKKYCIENFSCSGDLPTKIFGKKNQGSDTPVLLMAHPSVDAKLWQLLSQSF